jgi:phytoene synthase
MIPSSGSQLWPRSERVKLARPRIPRHLVTMAALVDFVRRHDPDRFLTALFAPPDRRPALLALYAFNRELARAREAVREPALALVRLQWWREVVEGATRHHEVATPLAAALDDGALSRNDLLALIDAREIEAAPCIATLRDWLDYLRGTAGGLAVAAARALGARAPEAMRDLGAAYGAAGVLRAVPALARQGRCLLPTEVLATRALSPEAMIDAMIRTPDAPAVRAVLSALAITGTTLLANAPHRLPRPLIAAALPAVLARRDLARLLHHRTPPPERGIGDRLAVTLAAARLRI